MNGKLGLMVWSGPRGQTKDNRYDWSETKRPDQRTKNKTKTRRDTKNLWTSIGFPVFIKLGLNVFFTKVFHFNFLEIE